MAANPALGQLQFLSGAWDMDLHEASFLPDPDAKVPGSVTFEWIEQGAALVMRIGDAATPSATWIIGRDDSGPAQISADQSQISGSWQKSFDGGNTWEHDFKVRYGRRSPP